MKTWTKAVKKQLVFHYTRMHKNGYSELFNYRQMQLNRARNYSKMVRVPCEQLSVSIPRWRNYGSRETSTTNHKPTGESAKTIPNPEA